MSVLGEKRYTKSHEWIRVDGSLATIGLSDFAQSELSDVVFVELPEAGKQVRQFDQVAVIESVKVAADVFAPVSGTVTAVNERLEEEPQLVNEDPFGDGWLFKMELSNEKDISELMSEEEYKKYIGS